jgi:hypothetical protein
MAVPVIKRRAMRPINLRGQSAEKFRFLQV